ncbi:MAG TPA: Asp-tRNA(Asn)/Glu-tRNA(Gln) amidotransferase subunit GatC [Gemmatimonadales bacterium]|nr:Asp-tRNA(Asn)/Glu-tRNA(Gln) amidotransferase subunit GatC [Gemmatimonadales bacterium]
MSIGEKEVLHAARLAELAVDEADLPRLVAQLGSIVAYVEQLAELPADETAAPHRSGAAGAPLRDDTVRRGLPNGALEALTAEFRDGFFLVPVRGTMAGG